MSLISGFNEFATSQPSGIVSESESGLFGLVPAKYSPLLESLSLSLSKDASFCKGLSE